MLAQAREVLENLLRYAFDGQHAQLRMMRTKGTLASVAWKPREEDPDIRVRISRVVLGWPEPALIGLLGHELCHPIAGVDDPQPEHNADVECVERGLGAYLALERAYTGRYHDQRPRGRGRDRYLGYASIRAMLDGRDINSLDRLLRDSGVVPHLAAAHPAQETVVTVTTIDGQVIIEDRTGPLPIHTFPVTRPE